MSQSKKRWAAKVTTESTHPPEGLFTKGAATIARTLASKKVSPKGPGSGMRMLTFFINRGGRGLTEPASANWRRPRSCSRSAFRRKRQERPREPSLVLRPATATVLAIIHRSLGGARPSGLHGSLFVAGRYPLRRVIRSIRERLAGEECPTRPTSAELCSAGRVRATHSTPSLRSVAQGRLRPCVSLWRARAHAPHTRPSCTRSCFRSSCTCSNCRFSP